MDHVIFETCTENDIECSARVLEFGVSPACVGEHYFKRISTELPPNDIFSLITSPNPDATMAQWQNLQKNGHWYACENRYK